MKKTLTECSTVGKLMVLIGLFVMTPIIALPFYPHDAKYIMDFAIPGGVSLIGGALLCVFGKKEIKKSVRWRANLERTSMTVLFAWLWGVIVGAAPFVISGQLTVIQALFEAVSGWTTTGLSTMDVSITPMIYLFHRSFMQYCGGLGFVLLMIQFITNKQSMDLYSAEGHPDKLMPNLRKTAHAIFFIYNLCLVLGTIAYRVAGMTWFDGICHAMCSLSTGGFSTKLASIGEYDSLSIEIITIVLMIIGTTNFGALLLLARGKVKSFFKVSEVKFMFILLAVAIPLVAFSLSDGLNLSLRDGFRRSSFDVISALSTTGYSTMSYAEWPQFAIGILILMMIIGGGIGSTAGGMKIQRIYLMLRLLVLNLKERISPPNTVKAPHYIKATGKARIDKETADETTSYILMYLVIYIVGSIMITATADCTLTEAMFDFSSAMSTVGLSIGITNPTTNNPTLIIEMIGMLLGRLEIFIVFIGCSSAINVIKKRFSKK